MRPASPWKARKGEGPVLLPVDPESRWLPPWLLLLIVAGVLVPPLAALMAYRKLEARVEDPAPAPTAASPFEEEERAAGKEDGAAVEGEAGVGDFLSDMAAALEGGESSPLVRLETTWQLEVFQRLRDRGMERLTFIALEAREDLELHRVTDDLGRELAVMTLARQDGRWRVLGVEAPSPRPPSR